MCLFQTCDLQLKAAAGSNTSCLPLCCKNDFCNNHCELATTTTTTTTTTTHTTPTSQPTSHGIFTLSKQRTAIEMVVISFDKNR